MFILGTICCRGGSKGVPGKNLKLLNGKPLLAYTIETAKQCALLNALIVSTDDELIAKTAKEYGISVPFIRPKQLATDIASKWDVFRHAVNTYELQNNKQVDYLVDIDVTVPLKTTKDISGAIETAIQNLDTDVVITAYEPERNPYFNMMEINGDGYAHIVKKSIFPIVRRQDAPKVYSLTPAAYVIKRSALYNYDHWSHAKCSIYEMPRERAIDIDTLFDMRFVEFLLKDG